MVIESGNQIIIKIKTKSEALCVCVYQKQNCILSGPVSEQFVSDFFLFFYGILISFSNSVCVCVSVSLSNGWCLKCQAVEIDFHIWRKQKKNDVPDVCWCSEWMELNFYIYSNWHVTFTILRVCVCVRFGYGVEIELDHFESKIQIHRPQLIGASHVIMCILINNYYAPSHIMDDVRATNR